MKTVLITGATGAVGSALVPLFLREEGTAVRLLLRADSEDHLRERLEGLCRFWELDPHDAGVRSRLEALRGDVSASLLGLEPGVYRRLAGEVTHLIHAAGNVKLNQPLIEARRSAVDSLREVVGLARAGLEAGSLAKLDYVSTVGVAGRTRGLVREAPFREPHPFHNTYEAAKAEAEATLLDEMGAGLPATIHRPSMVVGDSQTGKVIHFQVFYYLSEFFAGRKTWGVVPTTGGVRLDIIPADYVARALHLASGRADAVGRLFHLCSGPDHALGLSDLAERVRALFRRAGVPVPRLRSVSPRWLRLLLPVVSRLAPPGPRRALQSLPFFLAYLDEEQLFDNTQTRAFFAPRGLDVPPVEGYLEKVVGYYVARKYGPPGAGLAARGA
jgi:thioester reductase-like protein